MKLIADSGSTKTDWALTGSTGETPKIINTTGYNPYFIDETGMIDSLRSSLLPHLNSSSIKEIFFYGAGCSSPGKQSIVRAALQSCFPDCRSILVGHDLLGAARALLGKNEGFAAILGTGANTCLYDGKDCTFNIDSLGYMIGDEGSASFLGKIFLRDFMRNLIPLDLIQQFREQYHAGSNESILQQLYGAEFPNRFLAKYASFSSGRENHEYIRTSIRNSFQAFFNNLVSKYPAYEKYTFNCVGSVAWNHTEILREVAASFNMKTGKIIKSPLEDLVKFHAEMSNE